MGNEKSEIRNVEMKKCEALGLAVDFHACGLPALAGSLHRRGLSGSLRLGPCNRSLLKMCDKEVEVIDLPLCASSDEEEDPVKSAVVVLSDLEDSLLTSAFEYVYHF